MMTGTSQDLVLALLTRAQSRDRGLNKTKLLKLLYLADIEHFRKYGTTLTGFHWMFFLYGPWAAEYDELLTELERKDLIRIDPWSEEELSGAHITAVESRDLNEIIQSADEYFRTVRLVDTWTDRSLRELLDYVYFDTDPMRDAVSLAPLDFNKIQKEAPAFYRRSRSGAGAGSLNRLRSRFAELRERGDRARSETLTRFERPIYDEPYSQALSALSDEAEF